MGSAPERHTARHTTATKAAARRAFLLRLQEDVPDLLDELVDGPYVSYRAFRDAIADVETFRGRSTGYRTAELAPWWKAVEVFTGHSHFDALREDIANVLRRYHLHAEWLEDVVFTTMQQWGLSDADIKVGKWLFIPMPDRPFDLNRFTPPPVPGWLPPEIGGHESWTAFRGRAEEAFERALVAYGAAVDAYVNESDGRVRAKWPKLMLHAQWFIDYQVHGNGVTEIARRVHRDRRTVENAIQRMAIEYLELERLAKPRGRPRKK